LDLKKLKLKEQMEMEEENDIKKELMLVHPSTLLSS